MKNDKLRTIKAFADSEAGSTAEDQFASGELQSYFDEKLKSKYANKLKNEFDLKRQNVAIGSVEKKSNPIAKYLLFAIGLILVALAVYYFGSSRNTTEMPTLTAYKKELYTPIDVNIRGNISDLEQSVGNLIEAYENKNFPFVISEYQKLKSSNVPLQLNVEQMAGIAFGSTEQFDQAIRIFQGILGTTESSYSNHTTVRYLLGIVYLLDGNVSSAREMLQKLESGDYKYEEAQVILESL